MLQYAIFYNNAVSGKDEDMLNLPIPIVAERTQQQIANVVEASFAFRRDSERLLKEAKVMVEREIEGSEAL